LIALTNVAVIGLLLVPLVIASVIDDPDVAILAVLGLAAAIVGAPLAIAGLVCVHTARAAPDEAVF
jgi:archaellum biogenesis protein FlaJ (TadC family)